MTRNYGQHNSLDRELISSQRIPRELRTFRHDDATYINLPIR